MPHTTSCFLFEYKVLAYAQAVSEAVAGGEGEHGFCMTLDANGFVKSVLFDTANSTGRDLFAQCERSGSSCLLYDPFEPKEYTWLSWTNVDQSAMEKLLGDAIGPNDFLAPDWKPKGMATPIWSGGGFPISWGVMF